MQILGKDIAYDPQTLALDVKIRTHTGPQTLPSDVKVRTHMSPQTFPSDVTVRAESGHHLYEYTGSVVGKPFNVSASVLEAMEFPIPKSQLLALSNMTERDFVVVTAANARYFGGIIRLILTVRKYLPTHMIIVCNMGLTGDQVKEVKKERESESKSERDRE